jgi:signal transduction histidine kinase/ActR/RegA family two-component response regulator
MDLNYQPRISNDSFYKEILNTLDSGVILYDENGFLKHANAMAFRILPNLKDTLSRYSHFIGFIYEHSLEYSDQSQLSYFPTHRAGNIAFNEIVRIGDNNYYSVHMVYKDSINKKDLIVELFDISHLKNRADDILSLDKDKRFLTKAIQTSEKGIFVAENKGDKFITFANHAMSKFFQGHDLNYSSILVEDFLSVEFENDWQDIKKLLEHSGQEYFWRLTDGDDHQKQWLRLNLFVENPDHQESLIIGFISDETKSKHQENQLFQNQKLEAIGKLAGGIAHDFNNILSIVEGYTRLSEVALRRGESIDENISRIKQAVSRGSSLTKQLLTFGKHRVKENGYIDICIQIKEIEKLLKPLLGADINLIIKTIDTPCVIRSNADSISQIIMNLVINARDAISDGGDITISIDDIYKNNLTYVVIEVRDTGSGIDPKIQSKIFDPFFTTKEQGKGTGLGLSMVYGIVQQLDGIINISSALGEGTVFRIEIPMAVTDTMIEFNHQIFSDTHSLKGKTILVAEDEEDLLTIMEATLKELEMVVLKANNGNDALVIHDEYEGKIDFLLTDMVMPKLGGLKLAELIKEERPETHILYMSGYPSRGDISNFSLPEGSIFMAKPVKPELLFESLTQILSGQFAHTGNANLWEN